MHLKLILTLHHSLHTYFYTLSRPTQIFNPCITWLERALKASSNFPPECLLGYGSRMKGQKLICTRYPQDTKIPFWILNHGEVSQWDIKFRNLNLIAILDIYCLHIAGTAGIRCILYQTDKSFLSKNACK